MNKTIQISGNRSEGQADDAPHHRPNATILGAVHAQAEGGAHFTGSGNMSQQSSDEEYEGPGHLESVWLSRAHSRVEELRRLFNLPPSEVKPPSFVCRNRLSLSELNYQGIVRAACSPLYCCPCLSSRMGARATLACLAWMARKKWLRLFVDCCILEFAIGSFSVVVGLFEGRV